MDAVLGWLGGWGRGVVGRDIVVVGRGGEGEGLEYLHEDWRV